MKTNLLIVAICSLVGLPAEAQVPVTDLFLFQLEKEDTSKWHVHSPQLLSSFNQGGYTNQPHFFNDTILYLSVRHPDSSQNDLVSLNLDELTVTRITRTAESEYSPMPAPDGETFTCVRQVMGDTMDQQIFRYPLDRSFPGNPVLPSIKTIGYYVWLGEQEIAAFLVGEPVRLAIADTETGEYQVVASNIGRCLKRMIDGRLAFVHKYNDDYWYLKVLNTDSRRSEIVTEVLDGQEDFAIGPGGEFFMARDSSLYVFDPATSDRWIPVSNFSIYGIDKITRLAINSNYQLALVSQKP